MRCDSSLAALVLAAGCSSRAPGFKPLLPLGESTVVENTINSLRRAGVGDIAVVVGHRAGDLSPVLAGLPVRTVFNERYLDGMYSSVVAGVRSLPASTEAFYLLPADMPLVKSHTVKLLARAYKKTGADVVYPVFANRRGHPPLISSRLAPAIMAWSGPEGLRALLARYEASACDVAVIDEGILLDIDTPADYREALECRRRHIPTASECDAILAMLNVADATVRHCRLVADIAGRLAGRLRQAGLGLDAGLAAAAGSLHDLAKGRPDHARQGARTLRRLGYPQVAAVVARHHDIAFPEDQPLDEAAVVYLADKLVRQDRIVSIDERFRCALERFAGDDAALAAAAGRLATAQSIIKNVEQVLGVGLREVIAAQGPIQIISAGV